MIGHIVDNVVIMGYDEHSPGSVSGSIASQGWFEDGIDNILKRIPKEKAIIALG